MSWWATKLSVKLLGPPLLLSQRTHIQQELQFAVKAASGLSLFYSNYLPWSNIFQLRKSIKFYYWKYVLVIVNFFHNETLNSAIIYTSFLIYHQQVFMATLLWELWLCLKKEFNFSQKKRNSYCRGLKKKLPWPAITKMPEQISYKNPVLLIVHPNQRPESHIHDRNSAKSIFHHTTCGYGLLAYLRAPGVWR